MEHDTYWMTVWKQYRRHKLGVIALFIVSFFLLIGIYAPFLASSKPLAVNYRGEWYFPLFRYLFYPGFFSKPVDIFYNLLMFTFPLFMLILFCLKRWKLQLVLLLGLFQICGFVLLWKFPPLDPASSTLLSAEKQKKSQEIFAQPIKAGLSWQFELAYMNSYEKLNSLIQYRIEKYQHERLMVYNQGPLPTVWNARQEHEKGYMERYQKTLNDYPGNYVEDRKRWELSAEPALRDQIESYAQAESGLNYYRDKNRWFEEENTKINFIVMPLVRNYHWEDDAGGKQSLNQYIGWQELTRINRKDLTAALIFGVRISLMVGILSVGLALLIGIPVGSSVGYYGGWTDIIASRLMEIWEAMPTFFMLLIVVSILQSKSIFLVISVIGLFGWTGFSRFLRGEFFKQRKLPYVEACRALGFSDRRIIFFHILPNAIPPLLTMLPFAIMGAISSEAGLSFLGLGEEESSSWGVLMDEGRTAFPGESYLLWPPALMLTILLIAIAIMGDSLRDSIDPKLRRS